MTTHTNLAQGRWSTLSIAEQLGNIGSEFERAWAAKQRNLSDRYEKAFARMRELLELTLEDPRWKGPRLKELARVREEACAALQEKADATSVAGLKRYFLAFAVLARSSSAAG